MNIFYNKYFLYFFFILFISCSEEKKNDKDLLLQLEDYVHNDNYYLYSLNRNSFKVIKTDFVLDTLNPKYKLANELDKINEKIEELLRNVRCEFIANLNGNNLLAVADTLKLEQIERKEDHFFTKKFYNSKFIKEFKTIKLIQKQLINFLPNESLCDLDPIDENWYNGDLTAKEFIIKLTMTQNLLYKRVNCLFHKIY